MRDRMGTTLGMTAWVCESLPDRACTLGHRRLAIIDLLDAAAKQIVERRRPPSP